jgi:hypothetical protein
MFEIKLWYLDSDNIHHVNAIENLSEATAMELAGAISRDWMEAKNIGLIKDYQVKVEEEEMLVKDFLSRLSPTLKVIIYDEDQKPGKDKKEGEAGALAVAYHFNNNSYVCDFMITSENITLYVKRK